MGMFCGNCKFDVNGNCFKTECKDNSLWEAKMEKPPLGLMPEKLHLQSRLLDILDVVGRYEAVGKIVPVEWKDEVIVILERMRKKGDL